MTNIFIFRGFGALTFPTIVCFFFQYCFALPLSFFLVFTSDMHLTGYYLTLCISFLIEIFVDNGYLYLYKLPSLSKGLQSSEQQPLNAKQSLATCETECPQPLQTWSWVTRCCLLICLALFVNSIVLGIHFSTNYFLN